MNGTNGYQTAFNLGTDGVLDTTKNVTVTITLVPASPQPQSATRTSK